MPGVGHQSEGVGQLPVEEFHDDKPQVEHHANGEGTAVVCRPMIMPMSHDSSFLASRSVPTCRSQQQHAPRRVCPPQGGACKPGGTRQGAPGGALPRALWHNSVCMSSTLIFAYLTDEENALALSPVGFHHDHLHVLGRLVCTPEQTKDT